MSSVAERLLRFGACLTVALMLSTAGCHSGGEAAAKKDSDEAPAAAVETAKATVKPMDSTVHAQGTLAPGQGSVAHVAAPLPGRLQNVLVREGDRVTAGQVVAVLDGRQQAAQASSAAAALTAAQAQAHEAELAAAAAASDQSNGLRIARLAQEAAVADRVSSVQQAETALATAQTDLKRIRSGARPQEIAQADQTVRQDQATLDRARTELVRVRSLYSNGIAARRQLDDAQTAVTVAETGLESAKQQAALLRAGARPEEVHAAELAVKQAQDALIAVERSGDLKVSQATAALRQAREAALQVQVKQQDVLVQRRTAAQKQADLAAAQATSAYTVVRAPLSGIVTRRTLGPGDLSDPATPILEITDTHALNLVAELPAQDGLKVRPGMVARVAVPDLPDGAVEARVLSVGQVDPQTNLLAVRIVVPNPKGVLKSGAFATADIVVESTPHAIVVPKSAIVNHEGGAVVFVVGSDSVAHLHEVELGAEAAGFVEIRKGVAEGDPVVTLGQYELADGAKVEVSSGEEGKGKTEEGGAKGGEGADAKPGAEKPAPEGKEPAGKEPPDAKSAPDTKPGAEHPAEAGKEAGAAKP